MAPSLMAQSIRHRGTSVPMPEPGAFRRERAQHAGSRRFGYNLSFVIKSFCAAPRPPKTRPMPIYEYRCASCGHELEALQKFSDAPLVECPACHQAELRKKVSAAGFHLKGSGWYVTDFRNSGAKPKAKEAKEANETKDAKDAATATKAGNGGEARTDTKTGTSAPAEPASTSTTTTTTTNTTAGTSETKSATTKSSDKTAT